MRTAGTALSEALGRSHVRYILDRPAGHHALSRTMQGPATAILAGRHTARPGPCPPTPRRAGRGIFRYACPHAAPQTPPGTQTAAHTARRLAWRRQRARFACPAKPAEQPAAPAEHPCLIRVPTQARGPMPLLLQHPSCTTQASSLHPEAWNPPAPQSRQSTQSGQRRP